MILKLTMTTTTTTMTTVTTTTTMTMPPPPPTTTTTIIQAERISAAVSQNILFSSLDDEQRQTVVDAMFEVTKTSGEYVINQGDAGDNFYIIDQGNCEAHFLSAAVPLLWRWLLLRR